MIEIKSLLGNFVITNGELDSDNPTIKKVFNDAQSIEVDPAQGDPDLVIGKRMIAVLGNATILGYINQQKNPDTTY